MASKRKYLLFSADDGRPDSAKPCAFFASSDGCRNGASCKFSHSTQPVNSQSSNIHNNTADGTTKSDTQNKTLNEKYESKKQMKNEVVQENPIPYKDVEKSMQEQMKKQRLEFEQKMKEQQLEFERMKQAMEKQKGTSESNTKSPNNKTVSKTPNNDNNNKNKQADPKPNNYNNITSSSPFQPLFNTTALTGMSSTNPPTTPIQKSSNTPKSQTSNSNNKKNTTTNNNNSNNNVSNNNKSQQQQHNQGNNTYAIMANNDDDDDDDDDSDVVFDAVNTVIGTVNKPGLSFISPVQQQQPLSASKHTPSHTATTTTTNTVSNAHNSMTPLIGHEFLSQYENPFLPPQDTINILKSSNSMHALLGPKKSRQQNTSNPNTTTTNTTNTNTNANINKNNHTQTVTSHAEVTFNHTPTTTSSMIHSESSHTTYSPNLNHQGMSWENMIIETRKHSKYSQTYTFNTDSSWVNTRPPGDWCRNLKLYPILALDCEMCETQDPLTGHKDTRTLIRLSIVNGLEPSEVLLDTFVQPMFPITDLRTNIHGITQDMLNNAPAYTLRHAQAAIMNMCTNATILVGHSLHNDLVSLKLNHNVNVDTAFLYHREGSLYECPSLRELSKYVLGVELPNIHDSIRDASVAMSLAQTINKHGLQPPVPRMLATADHNTTSTKGFGSNNSNTQSNNKVEKESELLVHRVPDNFTEKDIFNMILSQTQIVPLTVTPIIRQSDAPNSGKAFVQFSSIGHCNLSFDSLTGPNRPDKANRPQKRVYIKGGSYINVRKFK